MNLKTRSKNWKGARVVDQDCLENNRSMRTVGSNPTPSAKHGRVMKLANILLLNSRS